MKGEEKRAIRKGKMEKKNIARKKAAAATNLGSKFKSQLDELDE